MNILIFVGIALALFGSVYWLKPSPKDKRIADLRLQAIKLGMQVKLRKFDPDSKETGIRNEINAAHYTLFKPAEKSSKLRWCVVRQEGWEQEGLPQGWSWHNKHADLDLAALNALIQECEFDVQVLAAYDNRTILVSDEKKDGSADQIKSWLDKASSI